MVAASLASGGCSRIMSAVSVRLAPLVLVLAACTTGEELFSDGDAGDSDDDPECPDGWTAAIEGHCYRVFADKSTFEVAEDECAAAESGGHLATVDDQDEIAAVVPLLAGLTDGPWIGAEDPDGDCNFSWVTGEPWSWPFPEEPGQPPWAGAEPSACGVDTCVHLYSVGVFNDIDCTMELPRLCELELE
jgi:hypothetical protein